MQYLKILCTSYFLGAWNVEPLLNCLEDAHLLMVQ